MPAPRIIGFTGLKGSGKDTAALAFIQRGYVNVKFADPLKLMLRTLLEYKGAHPALIDRMIDGDLKEKQVGYLDMKTPRHAMQTLGTEWGRQLMDQDFWVDTFMERCAWVLRESPIVVTDVRFPNEVEAVHRLGGMIYRVENPNKVIADIHPSEAHIPTLPVDGEIPNDVASAEEFTQKVDTLFFGRP